jgi:putative transposase
VAFVVEAYARRILGWRVAPTMATSMVLDAIEQAIWTRQQEGVLGFKDVVHHTDYAGSGLTMTPEVITLQYITARH